MKAPALLILQLTAHASLLCSFLWFTPQDWFCALAVYCITGLLGMTVTYHRLLAHKSWSAPRWLRTLGTLAGAFGMTGSPIAWVAVHRQHHRFTDTDRDPHSPMFMRWWWVQWFSMLQPVNVKYAADLMRDPFQVRLHRVYELMHVATLTFLLTTLGLKGAMIWYLTPAAILWNAGSLVNTLCHFQGYRRYETRDASRNLWLLGLLMFGEGFHNNHHGSPKLASFSRAWWEIDLGGLLIRALPKARVRA